MYDFYKWIIFEKKRHCGKYISDISELFIESFNVIKGGFWIEFEKRGGGDGQYREGLIKYKIRGLTTALSPIPGFPLFLVKGGSDYRKSTPSS